MNILLFRK